MRTLRLLKPSYEQATEIWQSSMLPLCARYLQVSESAGAAIDLSLVEDVIVRAQQEAVVRG